ncbi:MAG: hypothetical protein MRJ96_08130 [Nitrospirales bacterium]|nr:hypothetical protein [Nitrospira sp.]MDR4501399.1 hypothetical protein [Nitrospirales bacterium]
MRHQEMSRAHSEEIRDKTCTNLMHVLNDLTTSLQDFLKAVRLQANDLQRLQTLLDEENIKDDDIEQIIKDLLTDSLMKAKAGLPESKTG